MAQYTDVVIDIETTGTGPELNAVIQIGAVQFNHHTREVSPAFFNRCLLIPHGRYWDESTREWWCRMPDQLASIYARMEDPRAVMEDFYSWLGGDQCHLAAWSKPLSFDIPFISSYCKEFCNRDPLPFWLGRDLRSYVAGLNRGKVNQFNEKQVLFEGVQHDAFDDALHELRILYAAMDFHQSCERNEELLQVPAE